MYEISPQSLFNATRRQANDAGAQHLNKTAPMFRADQIHNHVHYSASECMH